MSFTVQILRPDDLLNLRVRCINLRIDSDEEGASRLMPASAADAFLVFVFPPQSITERAYYDSSANTPPPDPNDGGPYNQAPGGGPPVIGNPDAPGDAPARMSGRSQLVFRLGADARLSGVPLTTAGLLDWSRLDLVVSPLADLTEDADAAARQNAPAIGPPGELETAIELPYRLVVSPTHLARWRHASAAVTHGGRTELWHTAIVRDAGGDLPVLIDAAHPEPLRAIWSPDYRPDDPPLFGQDDPVLRLTSMTPYDRHQIVILTSDFHHYVTEDFASYIPSPFFAEQLMLSPLGGWLKSRGGWDPPFKRLPRRPVLPFPWREVLVEMPGSVRSDLQVRPNPAAGQVLLEHLGGGLTAGAPVHPAPAGAPPAGTPTGPFVVAKTPSVFDTLGQVVFKPLEHGPQLDLSEWVHVATQGRDHYVRIVYEGRLYPFGHRAALVKITERKFRNFTLPNGTTTPVAYMVQRMFIVVRERVRDFGNAAAVGLSSDGRAMPLKKVRLTTTVTPTISYPFLGVPPVPGANGVFWVMVDVPGSSTPTDFLFHAVGTDVAGDEIDFTTALIFVPNSRASQLTALGAVRTTYATSGDRRACRTPGQRVTLAPREAGSTAETTTVECDALYFTTEDPKGAATADHVRAVFCTPRLYKAAVNIPAAAAIVGSRTATTIGYYADYLAQGFTGAGGVFATVVKEGPLGGDGMPTLVGDKIGAEFAARQSGGIATPNMDITSLSRRHGPLAGDPLTAAANTFDPGAFFPKTAANAAMLFGAFSLASLVKLPGGSQTMDKDAPKMRVRTEAAPARVVAELDWSPNVGDVKDIPLVAFRASAANGSKAALTVKARIEKLLDDPVNGGHTQIDGSLTSFRVEFVDAVEVHFEKFAFTSRDGAKPDVSVALNSSTPVTFIGDLRFVETLRALIPPGLLGSGPSLDVNAERVHAGFSVAIPPASVGVFSLSNIRLGAFVELPFTSGRPIFDFAFSLRQEPFTLAVAIFGGTGFFHLQLDTEGLRLLEAALEFGAMASIDIGVASGGVHILAGIYFKLEKKESGGDLAATLSGYLRMGGELSVLGLVSISVEFVLSFTYHHPKATGRATLTVKVEIAFFSTSVELSVERSFGSGPGDPTFADVLPAPGGWAEYAAAFA